MIKNRCWASVWSFLGLNLMYAMFTWYKLCLQPPAIHCRVKNSTLGISLFRNWIRPLYQFRKIHALPHRHGTCACVRANWFQLEIHKTFSVLRRLRLLSPPSHLSLRLLLPAFPLPSPPPSLLPSYLAFTANSFVSTPARYNLAPCHFLIMTPQWLAMDFACSRR